MDLELSTGLLAEIGGWAALKEARILFERGKVTEVRREGNILRGSVQGAEKIYEAQIVARGARRAGGSALHLPRIAPQRMCLRPCARGGTGCAEPGAGETRRRE